MIMAFNKLTPGANLLWESSRMMLPEHKKQIQKQRRALNIQTKPLLDEQEQEYQSQRLDTAFRANISIEIEVFDLYQNQLFLGKIKKINLNEQALYLKTATELEVIHFSNIINVVYKEALPDFYF